MKPFFALGACVNDQTFLDLYIKDDRRRQSKLIRAILDLPEGKTGIPQEALEDLRQQATFLRSEMDADTAPEVKAFDMARCAELVEFYRLFYVPYCNTVHTSLRDLSSHVQEDSQGEIKSLQCGPESADVEDIVDAAIQIFFAATHFILKIFPQPDQENEFERLWAEHKSHLEKKEER